MNTGSADLPTLRQWLLDANFKPILELARRRKRVLSLLTGLTYDKDPIVSRQAIRASGLSARVIAETDPEYVRNYLLRLFWLVNDESGGVGWRAPELIGEILHHCPEFGQFFPMLISLLDLESEDAPRFRAGTLWAIGRVAQTAKDAMLPALSQVQAILLDPEMMDTDSKENASWCIAQLTGETL